MSISGIHVDIFRIIQEYSVKKDYDQLMDCSNAFTGIKLETKKYYVYIGPIFSGTLTHLAAMVSSVQDKSKQISMNTSNQDFLLNSQGIYDGIGFLIIRGPFINQLSCSWFNNIRHLTLVGIQQILSVDLFMNSTVKLELISCDFEEIRRWNTNMLKKLLIRNCFKLSRFPVLGNISKVLFFSNPSSENISQPVPQNIPLRVGHQKELYLSGGSLTLETVHSMVAHPNFLTSVQRLTLSCLLPRLDYSLFLNVPSLALDDENDNELELTNYHGKKLSLGEFNCSLMVGQNFPNLESCFLWACQLETFPLFPKLQVLKLEECQTISSVFSSPALFSVTIINCPELNDISQLGQVNVLNIRNCPELASVPQMVTAHDISIVNCGKIKYLTDMTQGWSASLDEKRVVYLSNLRNLKSVSFCKNIYHLELEEINCHIDGSEINEIHLLTLNNCENLESLSRIGQIENLELLNCNNLKNLDGLEKIPNISVSSCHNLTPLDLSRFTAIHIKNCPQLGFY
jgi:hypothetical protein